MPLLSSTLLAAFAATLAWRADTLRPDGAVAATAVGTVVLHLAGWMGGLILMAFFLPTSAISRLWPAAPSVLDAKGDRRDGWQVVANSGGPALALLLGGPGAMLGFAAGLAAAAADSWATAVGAHSPTPPRHILRGTVVPPGTSGGVTPRGALGAVLGGGIVAATALPVIGWRGAGSALLLGTLGMFLDSALGATVQGRFHCDGCGEDSERRAHRCGRATRPLGGLAWFNNDAVNALATTAVAIVGWAGWAWYCAR